MEGCTRGGVTCLREIRANPGLSYSGRSLHSLGKGGVNVLVTPNPVVLTRLKEIIFSCSLCSSPPPPPPNTHFFVSGCALCSNPPKFLLWKIFGFKEFLLDSCILVKQHSNLYIQFYHEYSFFDLVSLQVAQVEGKRDTKELRAEADCPVLWGKIQK